MAKRKGKVEQAVVVPGEAEVAAPGEAAVVAPPEAASQIVLNEEQRYTLGTWGGRTQWKCTRCPFDTLNGKAEMLAHWENHHVVHEPKKVPTVQAFDARGKPIEH